MLGKRRYEGPYTFRQAKGYAHAVVRGGTYMNSTFLLRQLKILFDVSINHGIRFNTVSYSPEREKRTEEKRT